jgi:hypothetical protein
MEEILKFQHNARPLHFPGHSSHERICIYVYVSMETIDIDKSITDPSRKV